MRLSVDPAGVTGLEPADAVVSLVDPADLTSLRSAFCNEVHFFASPNAAALAVKGSSPDAASLHGAIWVPALVVIAVLAIAAVGWVWCVADKATAPPPSWVRSSWECRSRPTPLQPRHRT